SLDDTTLAGAILPAYARAHRRHEAMTTNVNSLAPHQDPLGSINDCQAAYLEIHLSAALAATAAALKAIRKGERGDYAVRLAEGAADEMRKTFDLVFAITERWEDDTYCELRYGLYGSL